MKDLKTIVFEQLCKKQTAIVFEICKKKKNQTVIFEILQIKNFGKI